MSRREIVADDLTGADLTGQDNTSVKITFDGKSASVDLSDASKAALADFVAGNGSDALARLLARSAAARPGTVRRSGSRSGTSGRRGQARLAAGQRLPGPGRARQVLGRAKRGL